MTVFKDGKIETKPASYSLIINSGDTDQGILDFRLKVTRNNLPKFIDMLPLLAASQRRMFNRLAFWIDVPVDISLMITPAKTIDLSAASIHFSVIDGEMNCWVPGYINSVSIKTEEFVGMVHELYELIEGADLAQVKNTVASSAKDGHESFRVSGIQVPNSYAGLVLAVHNADACIIGRYIRHGIDSRYNRFESALAIKYFTYNEDNGWTMVQSLPYLTRDLFKATASINLF